MIIYSSFGGINALLSLITDSYLIRATNRYSAVIATIGPLYFSFSFYRLTHKSPSFIRGPLLALITFSALLDQAYFPYRTAAKNKIVAALVQSDRELVNQLKSMLPSQSMLFMRPIIPFPEGEPLAEGESIDFPNTNISVPFITQLNFATPLEVIKDDQRQIGRIKSPTYPLKK